MIVRKLTPVLFAEEIEPCLRFWVEKLGFEKPDSLRLDVCFDPPGDIRDEDFPQENGLPVSYRPAAQCCEDRIGLVFKHAQPGFFFRTLLTRSISFRAADRNVSSIPGFSKLAIFET